MKPLKPSHREKKRYLLIKGGDANKKNIEEVILKYIGVLGFARASPQILKSSTNSVIMIINRNELDKIRASFVMSDKEINIVKVSGAIGNIK